MSNDVLVSNAIAEALAALNPISSDVPEIEALIAKAFRILVEARNRTNQRIANDENNVKRDPIAQSIVRKLYGE